MSPSLFISGFYTRICEPSGIPRNDPYCFTYNPEWQNHPNFSQGGNERESNLRIDLKDSICIKEESVFLKLMEELFTHLVLLSTLLKHLQDSQVELNLLMQDQCQLIELHVTPRTRGWIFLTFFRNLRCE